MESDLPFACNAPFIQDPARVLIKEPSTSPTNRWLLQRAGRLAADTMLRWLGQDSLPREGRADAYALMPNVDREDASLEGTCGATVELAFADRVEGQPVLLTCLGSLVTEEECSILPDALFGVWEHAELGNLFETTPLAPEVSPGDRKKLLDWGLAKSLDRAAVAERLRSKAPAKPHGWERLFELWRYLSPDFMPFGGIRDEQELHLLPATGSPHLERTSELVRMRREDSSLGAEDWEFLGRHLRVVDPGWPDFLKQERKRAEESQSPKRLQACYHVEKVLDRLGFAGASSGAILVNRVANSLFSTGNRVALVDAVRLAQIAARWKVEVDERFKFWTRASSLRLPSNEVLVDLEGGLEDLLPETMRGYLLHESYSAFSSCSADEWNEWVRSGRSRLFQFPRVFPLQAKWLHNRKEVQEELDRREFAGQWSSGYVNPSFTLVDWDFSTELITYWHRKAEELPTLWVEVASHLITSVGDKRFWEPLPKAAGTWSNQHHQGRSAMSAAVVEIARNGNVQAMVSKGLRPTWLLRLRNLPCLPDTRGFAHKPTDLLRRTPATEAFIEVEPFLRHDLDTEEARPLLEMLGVRDQPLGPESVLSRLRALAKAEAPPSEELAKWYRRLDQITASCSPRDRETIAAAFQAERLILTAQGRWETAAGVFLSSSEEDAPGAEVIRPSLVDLGLWQRIGVAERPTARLAIRWLDSLPSGETLDESTLRRVGALLGRYGRAIWEEVGHWLTLDGSWRQVRELELAASSVDRAVSSSLFPQVKSVTADFHMLPASERSLPPFSDLPELASRLEFRPGGIPAGAGDGEALPWLHEAGRSLRRARFDDEGETRRVHALAETLLATRLLVAPHLSVTPYLDGTPAGQSVDGEVVWLVGERRLCVRKLPSGRLARLVPEEIARVFDRIDIRQALAFAYGREPRVVAAYFEENFTLDSERAGIPAGPESDVPLPDPSEGSGSDLGGDEEEGSGRNEPAPPAVPGELGVPGSESPTNPSPTGAGSPKKKSPQPDLMEQFLQKSGFTPEDERRYRHPDGTIIERVVNNVIPWERRNAEGQVIRRYWSKSQCLERDGLEIPHEVWSFLQKHPGQVSLVLADPEGQPVVVPGRVLLSRVETEEIGVFPATYRLGLKGLQPHQQ
ncbi:MAG: hypothetical protein JNJ70_21010 [Verrucomicrobiales bacterium]|nr:hypothetical protein [Verrucomicrobiales bacterium]